MLQRCPWPGDDPLMQRYHDEEWGVPLYDDAKLFEFLLLEGMQAGLSWMTILKKRENFRRAFAGFDAVKVARFNQQKVERLMQDAGIIRNRLKIEGAVASARAFLAVKDEFGSFSDYIWRFTDGKPVNNRWKSLSEIPGETELARTISKDLKKRGFRFVGPTIVYAHLQATGMVNDHLVSCYRYKEVKKLAR
ncbi:DNA-3-methyladenine glycosylase I [bacterium]|nr:DNA-3-methyladenine glycosylase I [bacterium]